MSFDSLDVYEEAWLPETDYYQLKNALIEAYNRHRSALKLLLDTAKPLLESRMTGADGIERKREIFNEVVARILSDESKDEYKVSPNLDEDLTELCEVYYGGELPSCHPFTDIGPVSDECFERLWPALTVDASRISMVSRSPGSVEFKDDDCFVQLHISSDCQGDFFGLDNAVTRVFDQTIETQQWTEDTGAICVAIDQHANVFPKSAVGNPKNPVSNLMPDDYWPTFLQTCKDRREEYRQEPVPPADDFEDDVPF
ncbi:hypothetical protein [Marinobacter shengliensis]|uniref:hypothetical protein n=1 Tax=Marinobacter shengliensis TaxID=1389223 RepID=UPI001108AE78|nr:hypothetical protein [Marinobacter shengliensis]